MDDPLWVKMKKSDVLIVAVLIPLLVDDPLWERHDKNIETLSLRLNPSFSG